MDSAASCLELQLSEVEMLKSMYSEEELVFDGDCAPYLKILLNGDSLDDNTAELQTQIDEEGICLGFTFKILVDSHPAEIKFDFPKLYPEAAMPNVFVRTSGILSRQSQSKFRQKLDDFLLSLDKGEIMVLPVLDWVNEHLPGYVDSLDTPTETKSIGDGPCSFTRMWIYSHHIYSKFKRRDILAWASELSLQGFSMSGKPGMICAEGHTEDVEEYWARLRRLNWKRLVMKEREDVCCDSLDLLKRQFRFEVFEEKVFGTSKGSSSSFHSDIGLLRTFLQEHNCSHIFELYFGINGDSQSPGVDTSVGEGR